MSPEKIHPAKSAKLAKGLIVGKAVYCAYDAILHQGFAEIEEKA